MKRLYGILHIDANTMTSYQIVLLIFALYNITTVFFSVLMLTLSTLFVAIAILISKLFSKLELDSLKFPVLLILFGTVTTLCTVLSSNAFPEAKQVCISASLLTFYIYVRLYENKKDSVKDKFISAGKYLLNLIPVFFIFSFFSEILNSGKILNGFIKNGITILDIENNTRSNKLYIVLLFFALLVFISTRVSRNSNIFFTNEMYLKDSVKLGAVSILTSIAFSFSVITFSAALQNSVLLHSLKYFLPFLLTAIFSLILSSFIKDSQSCCCITSLIFLTTVYLSDNIWLNEKSINIIITAIVLLIVMAFNEFCSKKISNENYLFIILTYSAIISMVTSLLFI